ncbi:MAG: AraC family transcriptional regulator [Chitinophagaceae bacterium]|jgi:AraC-like DNA-binding protein|nr:AraC family transcriptional regulator [Chitinophagaceae bacterium]
MKITLEQIPLAAGRSFHLLLTPGLNDLYYWHFHPEWEIVYVEGATGTRHIGDHISRYEGSDLVLIASNIPHLNFDYGVTTDCEQVVIQMSPAFVGMEFFSLPELQGIRDLFRKTAGAIAFYGETKKMAGEMLKQIPVMDGFGQLMRLLDTFQCLARSDEFEIIDARPVESHDNFREQQRLKMLHRHVEENFREKPDTHAAASLVNLSMAAFCRYFKKATGLTYTDYVNKYRIDQARKLLLMDRNVTEACFDCGFENLSHFNRTFRRFAGENPSAFRKKHRG